MKYIGTVPASRGIICEIDEREWHSLLIISGVKEGEELDDEGRGAWGRASRRLLLELMARAVQQIAPCKYHTDSLHYIAFVAETMRDLAEKDMRYWKQEAGL